MIPKLNRGESAITFTFGTLFAGSFLLIIISYNDIRMTDWFNLPTMVWLTLGYLVIFSTAISFVLLQFAAMRLPSAKVMAYTYLTPVWVILWEVLIGNGLPQSYVIPGVLLTICALFILMKNEKKDAS
jgi:drug/metabolite transporter (DMT)-like permease